MEQQQTQQQQQPKPDEGIHVETDGFFLKSSMSESKLKRRAEYAGNQAEVVVKALLQLDPDGEMPEEVWATLCFLAVNSLITRLEKFLKIVEETK